MPITYRMPSPGEEWHHYLGDHYQIYDVALNTETKEPVVVYRSLDGKNNAFVCPLTFFLSHVNQADGRTLARFSFKSAAAP